MKACKKRNSANKCIVDGQFEYLRYQIKSLLLPLRETVIRPCLPSLMNNVNINILLLFLQICFASELGGSSITGGEGSHVGDLIKTKSGKVFLRRSSKKSIWAKKDTEEESGYDYSNDDKIKVKYCFFIVDE